MRAIALLLFLAPLLHAPACAAPQAAAEPAAAPAAKPRPARTRIAFSERGELIVDGKRRFIRAGHRSGQTDGFTSALKSAADAGFNMVHDYRFESIDIAKEGVDRYVEDARAYLRKANQLGLGVYLGLPRNAVRAADEETITAIVNALAGERALWMWYIYDEPRPEVLSVESASRVYKLLKRLDPERPAIMLTNKPSTMQQYRAYCDILWFDRYPIAATNIEKSSLKPIAEALDTAMKAGPVSEKPVWPVLQAQDNKGSPTLRKKRPDLQRPDDRTHRPNAAELRAAAHVAIARGAPAVAYYWAPESWYSMKTDTPGIWASLGRVLRELESLEPVLLAAVASQPAGLSVESGEVHTWSRTHEGQTYIGFVNPDINKPARALLPKSGSAGPFRKLLGDGTIDAGDRGTGIRLGPAGVVVIATGSG
jgi:hypothetical protein